MTDSKILDSLIDMQIRIARRELSDLQSYWDDLSYDERSQSLEATRRCVSVRPMESDDVSDELKKQSIELLEEVEKLSERNTPPSFIQKISHLEPNAGPKYNFRTYIHVLGTLTPEQLIRVGHYLGFVDMVQLIDDPELLWKYFYLEASQSSLAVFFALRNYIGYRRYREHLEPSSMGPRRLAAPGKNSQVIDESMTKPIKEIVPYQEFYNDVTTRLYMLRLWDKLDKQERDEVVSYMKKMMSEILASDKENAPIVQILKMRVEAFEEENIKQQPPAGNSRKRFTEEFLRRVVDSWPDMYKWLVMQPNMWNIPLKDAQDKTNAIMEEYNKTESPIKKYWMREHILETPVIDDS